MKQIEVTILGQSYLLACPEGGEALLHAAVATVDQEMSANATRNIRGLFRNDRNIRRQSA